MKENFPGNDDSGKKKFHSLESVRTNSLISNFIDFLLQQTPKLGSFVNLEIWKEKLSISQRKHYFLFYFVNFVFSYLKSFFSPLKL